MEYISAEEFLNQSKKIQEVFLNWWNPSVGDLFSWARYDEEPHNICCCNDRHIIEMTEFFKKNNSGNRIPLLTEGQLRRFIEDKTGGKVESYYAWDYYTIAIRNTECGGDDPQMDTEEIYLLQAYWKVAVEVAKEYAD